MRLILRAFTVLLVIAGALLAYGFFEATRTPRVVRYAAGLADWPPGQPPLRIVQLSDLHIGYPDMPPWRLRRIVAQVNALHPDLIVLTGDYDGGKMFDWPQRLEVKFAPLAALRGRYGVYAVPGNHDSPYWTARVFPRTGIPLLLNRWIDVGPVVVAGMSDLTFTADHMGATRQAVTGAPPGKPLLLLVHEPDPFQWLPRQVDMMFAGHTHGGQIMLPLYGTIELGDFYNRHLRGLFREHGQWLLVSSGVGTTLVPLRVGVPPEIVEVTLGPVTR